jgi:hypothetical protein
MFGHDESGEGVKKRVDRRTGHDDRLSAVHFRATLLVPIAVLISAGSRVFRCYVPEAM